MKNVLLSCILLPFFAFGSVSYETQLAYDRLEEKMDRVQSKIEHVCDKLDKISELLILINDKYHVKTVYYDIHGSEIDE